MSKKSAQIALGGVFSALCLLIMFLSVVIPFATYALPAFAGAMLIAVMEENGSKTAWLVYGSVSLLSLFIVPSREAALMFVGFFGYYPIIRQKLEGLRPTVIAYVVKLILFNTAMIASYALLIYAFGMGELLDGIGETGKYLSTLGMLALGNVTFVVYDRALRQYTWVYHHWFKPTFLRR